MKPKQRYTWRLEAMMHERGIHQISALQRELASRGVDLSSSQMHRLVTQPPERLNLEVLAVLCDVLRCSPAELIEVHALIRRAKAVNHGEVAQLGENSSPQRAQITRLPEE